MIECQFHNAIDSDWGHCAKLPVIHPECPPARVHRTACKHCLTGTEVAQGEVMAALYKHWQSDGCYYGDPKPEPKSLVEICPPPAERWPIAQPVRWVTAIVTAPRKGGVSYLGNTIRSMVRAGFPEPTVFAEPNSPIPDWFKGPVVRWPFTMGVWQNHLAALTTIGASMVKRDFDAILIAECDTSYPVGLRDYLDEHVLWPSPPDQLGFLSLYTSSGWANGPAGWHVFSSQEYASLGGFWGAQALVLSKRGLKEYVHHNPWAIAHPESKLGNQGLPGHEPYADGEISKWAVNRGRKIWYARTIEGGSLVRHDGGASSVFDFGIGGMRSEKVFAGDQIGMSSDREALMRERLTICEPCDRFEFDGVAGMKRCFGCGCANPVTERNIGQPDKQCPEKKWVR